MTNKTKARMFWTVLAIALALSFHHMMMADSQNLCDQGRCEECCK